MSDHDYPAHFTEERFFNVSGVSRETMENIRKYANLLVKWQKQINLVSDSTLPDLWTRHFYDSFQLKQHFDADRIGKLTILDIGSGAGFPGLLLSMCRIGDFHMVESNNKKCAFMRQVIRETQCQATIHNERVEKLSSFPVDYIISRACASLDKLFDLSRNFISDDTICLFLKGQIAEQEIAEARQNWDFQVEKFTSATEETGMILKVSHIKALSVVK
ncbi:16S rRNA (guanine(527)-N(7))-methyltransferase RsmG [Paremcibacter congregatus]|uniref:16S rRNA (guanine(527)-N(7))-methyltransferase RsmG n=1 Tax=Paremcibacter congregatus TaxID=2043170 RepID=UPI0030EB2AED|tara:strand:+ start:14190 stop:14843 length:654 start_codon:yes stop_codon:yes gene_type:complete